MNNTIPVLDKNLLKKYIIELYNLNRSAEFNTHRIFETQSSFNQIISETEIDKIINFFWEINTCQRCGKHYRSIYNLGKYQCTIRQHLFKNVDDLTNRYPCCNGDIHSRGCTWADHISITENYYGSYQYLKFKKNLYLVNWLLLRIKDPEYDFTKNHIIEDEYVTIPRVENKKIEGIINIPDVTQIEVKLNELKRLVEEVEKKQTGN